MNAQDRGNPLPGCDAEPIRFPGAVQPHGALLVVEPGSGRIVAASESCKALIGSGASELLDLCSTRLAWLGQAR
jgi:light-regulated signal transduction histidine kinase (bacteriophytochrome)